MLAAAESLEFERAAALRDRITQLRDQSAKSATKSKSTPREPIARESGVDAGKADACPGPNASDFLCTAAEFLSQLKRP